MLCINLRGLIIIGKKGKPYLDGLEWHIIADPVTQLAAFQKGEHHIMADVNPKDASLLEASGKFKISSVLGEYHQISGGRHPPGFGLVKCESTSGHDACH